MCVGIARGDDAVEGRLAVVGAAALLDVRDELRAENKQWRADWLNIEAENERLRAELQECQETLGIAEELL